MAPTEVRRVSVVECWMSVLVVPRVIAVRAGVSAVEAGVVVIGV